LPVTGRPLASHEKYRCSALAFSPDGSQLAGLLETLSNVAGICWDVASGRIVLFENHSADVLRNARGTVSYDGPAVAWIPDASGWLWKGHVLVDRESGRPYFVLPATTGHTRRMVAADRIVAYGTVSSKSVLSRSKSPPKISRKPLPPFA
jgi:hypothetical protein